MALLNFGGMISSITKTMSGAVELLIDRATVEDVREHLVLAREALIEAQAEMGSIPASVVGGSPYAAQLVHHSELANKHLLDTIDQITIGLERYDSAMEATLKDIDGTDDQVLSDLNVGHNNIEFGTEGLRG